MMKRALAAVQFLTVIPVSGGVAATGEAAIFFPLVGVSLGAISGGILLLAHAYLTRGIASLLSIAFLLMATGCLHEDGLADVADAIRAGRSREKMFAILKDSRIGTYGAVALIVTVTLRWQAGAAMQVNPVYGFAAALGVSRSALVIMAGTTPPAGEGLGRHFASAISRPVLAVVIGQACLVAFLAGWAYALGIILSASTIIVTARTWFIKRLGGVNGDCLGTVCQVVETANLVILTCRHSS
jgi:adenosylcobinamide-GDP ribazoletransferase